MSSEATRADFSHWKTQNLQLTVPVVTFCEKRGLLHEYKKLLGATQELFQGDTKVTVESDREIEGESYLVFSVTATGSIGDILSAERAWHRCVAGLPGDIPSNFRLSMDVQ